MFSYKIPNKITIPTWKQTSYKMIGESVTKDNALKNDINGITISPKRNFCITKIWIANCNNQNPKK